MALRDPRDHHEHDRLKAHSVGDRPPAVPLGHLDRGSSVRSPVPDQARSRVRREDVGDGSAAEDGGAHRLDGERREEDPLARTQDGRVDEKAVLVDQAGLNQRSGESCPTVGEQVSVGALPLEPRDGFGQVSGGDRRLAPVGGRESENTTLGISFIGLANGPEALGQ